MTAMDGQYVIGSFTFGSFRGWATDPLDAEEVRKFLADPPGVWQPRPQDELVVFELTQVDPADLG